MNWINIKKNKFIINLIITDLVEYYWIDHLFVYLNLVFILSLLNFGYTILFFSIESYFNYLIYFNFYLWFSILELFITLIFSLTFYN